MICVFIRIFIYIYIYIYIHTLTKHSDIWHRLTSYLYPDRAKRYHLAIYWHPKIACSSSQSNKSNSTIRTTRWDDTSHDAPCKSIHYSSQFQLFSLPLFLATLCSCGAIDAMILIRVWGTGRVWWKYLTVAGTRLLDTQDSRWSLMAVFSPGISHLNRSVPLKAVLFVETSCLVGRSSKDWNKSIRLYKYCGFLHSRLWCCAHQLHGWTGYGMRIKYNVSLHHWISSISKYFEWNSFFHNTSPFFRITYKLNDLQPRSSTQVSIDVSTSIHQPWITLWSMCSRGGWWLLFSEEIEWVRDAHSSLF